MCRTNATRNHSYAKKQQNQGLCNTQPHEPQCQLCLLGDLVVQAGTTRRDNLGLFLGHQSHAIADEDHGFHAAPLQHALMQGSLTFTLPRYSGKPRALPFVRLRYHQTTPAVAWPVVQHLGRANISAYIQQVLENFLQIVHHLLSL